MKEENKGDLLKEVKDNQEKIKDLKTSLRLAEKKLEESERAFKLYHDYNKDTYHYVILMEDDKIQKYVCDLDPRNHMVDHALATFRLVDNLYQVIDSEDYCLVMDPATKLCEIVVHTGLKPPYDQNPPEVAHCKKYDSYWEEYDGGDYKPYYCINYPGRVGMLLTRLVQWFEDTEIEIIQNAITKLRLEE